MIKLHKCSELSTKVKEGLSFVFCYDTLLAEFIYSTSWSPKMQLLTMSSNLSDNNEIELYKSITTGNSFPQLSIDTTYDKTNWIVCHFCHKRDRKITHRVSLHKE